MQESLSYQFIIGGVDSLMINIDREYQILLAFARIRDQYKNELSMYKWSKKN